MKDNVVDPRDREVIRSIAERHGARNVRVFGSVARGDARPDSDLDLLVEAGPSTTPWFPGGLAADLEEALGRRVDVVSVVGSTLSCGIVSSRRRFPFEGGGCLSSPYPRSHSPLEENTSGGREAFLASLTHQDAVLRNLQTMAEATQRLSAASKSRQPIIDWRALAGFRNVLVH